MGNENEKRMLRESVHTIGIVLENPKIRSGLIIPKAMTP